MAQQQQEVTEIIGGISLFADLSRPQLEGVAHTFEEEWYPDGQRILRQGFQGNNFYVILDGEAVVRIDGQDRVKLARGDFFGEVSVLLGEAPTADVVAARPLRCLVMPGSQVQGFLTAHPQVMFRLLQAQARRLRATLQWQS
ncbi:MAG TPA: cyclic nucleotide-binding domain-containing protein [Actinomycetota bacterium]|nr:cyclic nucleotide-binding domain-containing protein [Actinomycetota bacterium]